MWTDGGLIAEQFPQGCGDVALVEVQQETVEDAQRAGMAIVYQALGRKADSDAALGRLLKEHANGSAFEISVVYASGAI